MSDCSCKSREIRTHSPPIDEDIAIVRGVGPLETGSLDFRIPLVREVRARVHVGVLFVPDSSEGDPFALNIAGKGRLWLSTRDRGYGSGVLLTSRNLVGTKAAALSVPVDAGLLGFVDEWEVASDEIYGRFRVNEVMGIAGRWVLSVSYHAKDPMSPAEWQRVRELRPSLIGQALQLNKSIV